MSATGGDLAGPWRIRPYRPGDLAGTVQLFSDTIHAVCAADYTPAQLDAWAAATNDTSRWSESLLENTTLVAEPLNPSAGSPQIIGLADLSPSGWVNRLYTHKDWQGHGIGSLLLAKLEELARAAGMTELRLESSLTARRFYENRSYKVYGFYDKEVRGQRFRNTLMAKTLN